MGYLKAVLNNDTKNEIKNLKILIKIGKKLHKNVSKYEKELNQHTLKKSRKYIKIKPIKISKQYKKLKSNNKNTIKSVVSRDNMIIIDFNHLISKRDINFKEKKLRNSYQKIFTLNGFFEDAYPTKLQINGIKQIVINQEKNNKLKIILKDKINLKTIYIINKKRMIIKVLNRNLITKKTLKKTNSINSTIFNIAKHKIVVLDAGHGGKDSGAIGNKRKKRYEKYTVLKVTKYLEGLLKKRGYKVYLTRNSDTFIKLRDRTRFANRKNADIFISIHANAAPKSKIKHAKGIETFFLSPARSERAKRVAAAENKSDVRKMSGSTKQAFLESLNRPRITASQKLAIDIQRNMLFTTRKIHKDVVDSGVREGPFWVLVGAQMPSVLIEIGYVTHPIEGKRLFNTRYQQSLAMGIANGVDSYFLKNP